MAAFKDFGFDVPELTVAVFMEPGKIVRIGVPPLRLEVMNEISGVSFDRCYGRRLEATIDGLRVCFVDRESLLLNKPRVPKRDSVAARLKTAGIPTAVCYPKSLHKQPVFAPLSYPWGAFPVFDQASCEVLSLPMHPFLDAPTQGRIVTALRAALPLC